MDTTRSPDAAVSELRRFNRFYTRLLGLLEHRLLKSPFTLAEARLLYEINAAPGICAAELGRVLGMDRGQCSRLLAGLRKKGLIRREGEQKGRMPLPLSLSQRGRELVQELEAAADSQAAALLEGLSQQELQSLQHSLAAVQGLLQQGGDAAARRQAHIREAGLGELGWIVSRHATLYGQEYGFSSDFEAYVLCGLAEYLGKPRGGSRVWIAELEGRPAGSIGLVQLDDGRAQLRWLLVEPRARGLGLGRRLVDTALAFAAERGYSKVLLWTLQSLHAARALYATMGFELDVCKEGVMGGQPLTEECWVRRLEQAGAAEDGDTP